MLAAKKDDPSEQKPKGKKRKADDVGDDGAAAEGDDPLKFWTKPQFALQSPPKGMKCLSPWGKGVQPFIFNKSESQVDVGEMLTKARAAVKPRADGGAGV